MSYFSSISLGIYNLFRRKIEDICINNDWDDDELNDIANQISRLSYFSSISLGIYNLKNLFVNKNEVKNYFSLFLFSLKINKNKKKNIGF